MEETPKEQKNPLKDWFQNQSGKAWNDHIFPHKAALESLFSSEAWEDALLPFFNSMIDLDVEAMLRPGLPIGDTENLRGQVHAYRVMGNIKKILEQIEQESEKRRMQAENKNQAGY